MKARFYGLCPIAPGEPVALGRWFNSPAGYRVIVEMTDQRGVKWLGPEYPRDMAGHRLFDLQRKPVTARVRATEVDAINGWTDFELDAPE